MVSEESLIQINALNKFYKLGDFKKLLVDANRDNPYVFDVLKKILKGGSSVGLLTYMVQTPQKKKVVYCTPKSFLLSLILYMAKISCKYAL